MVTKVCKTCGQEKPLSAFHPHKGCKYGVLNHCRECRNAYVREYRQKNGRKDQSPEARRRYLLKRSYGITPEQYDEMLKSQDGRCAICRALPEERPKGILFVDHDHKTGAVRGLLCSFCNVALGYMEDDSARLLAAVDYLAGY